MTKRSQNVMFICYAIVLWLKAENERELCISAEKKTFMVYIDHSRSSEFYTHMHAGASKRLT